MSSRKHYGPRSEPRIVYTAVLKDEDDYGNRRHPDSCVLATELRDKYPELTKVFVNLNRISITTPRGDRLTWPTPLNVQKWIAAWDEGARNMPMEAVALASREAKVIPKKEGQARSLRERKRVREICRERGITTHEYNREVYQARKTGQMKERVRSTS